MGIIYKYNDTIIDINIPSADWQVGNDLLSADYLGLLPETREMPRTGYTIEIMYEKGGDNMLQDLILGETHYVTLGETDFIVGAINN